MKLPEGWARVKPPEGWLRVVLANKPPCFLYARGRERRFAVPKWAFPSFKIGDTVSVEIEPAEPFRAYRKRAGGFDWSDYITAASNAFPTEEAGGVLRIWNRYSEPFDLLRCPPIEPLYRMLGFYQAEGSKSATGADFSFANSNVELIRHEIENLNAIGIANAQLYGEILQGVGESRESAVATYESLPLDIHAVRPRTGRGGSAYVLHARNSKPFRGMVTAALADVFAKGFPSREAAKAFALDWLHGDGSITRVHAPARDHTELRLAGLAEEHHVVCQALNYAFDWSRKSETYKGNKQGTHLTLRTKEMLDLIDAHAFKFSMNYVRLLLGFDYQTHSIRENRRGPLARWGLVDKDGALTEVGESICAGHRKHLPEIEKARRLEATAPQLFGVKGAPNPLLHLLR